MSLSEAEAESEAGEAFTCVSVWHDKTLFDVLVALFHV